MTKLLKISAPLDYVAGHLKYGHLEAGVDPREIEGMTPEELKIFIEDVGTVIVDEWRVEDYGDVGEVTVEEQ